MGILTFFKDNFMHVAPVLLAGVFGIAIMYERYKTLFQTLAMKDSDAFISKAADLAAEGRSREAIAMCDQAQGKPLAKLVKSALERAHQPEDMIMSGIELELKDAQDKIQKRTSYLATIANVATLLGLLGTIAGLISSFEAVGHADAQQKSALLAAGISTAMNATMLGLGVAIPCMVAFSFLINRANHLVGELDTAGLRMLDAIKRSYYREEESSSKKAA